MMPVQAPTVTESGLGGDVVDVAVPGGFVRVESIGSGPAVMFVHGWTLDRRIWEPQAQALRARFRIVAPDRRGFGQSSAPPDLAREPADLLAIADRLAIDRFALVGMSQGARVALRVAADHPDRVVALALQGAPLSGVAGVEEEPPVAEMARLLAAGQADAMRSLWRAHPLMQVAGEAASALLDRICAAYEGRDLATPSSLDVTMADCARVRAPVLAITGEGETAWRHRVARTLESVAGAARIDIAGGGHLCNLDRPDDYNAALAGLLETHFGKGRGWAADGLDRMGTYR